MNGCTRQRKCKGRRCHNQGFQLTDVKDRETMAIFVKVGIRCKDVTLGSFYFPCLHQAKADGASQRQRLENGWWRARSTRAIPHTRTHHRPPPTEGSTDVVESPVRCHPSPLLQTFTETNPYPITPENLRCRYQSDPPMGEDSRCKGPENYYFSLVLHTTFHSSPGPGSHPPWWYSPDLLLCPCGGREYRAHLSIWVNERKSLLLLENIRILPLSLTQTLCKGLHTSPFQHQN